MAMPFGQMWAQSGWTPRPFRGENLDWLFRNYFKIYSMVRFCWYDLYNVTFQLFYSTLSPLLLFYMCSYKIHRSHHLMVHRIPNTGSIFPQRSESLGRRWQSVHVLDIPAPRALCLTDGPRTHPEQWRWRSWGSCCAAPPSLCCFWHRFQSSQNRWTLGWWDWDE